MIRIVLGLSVALSMLVTDAAAKAPLGVRVTDFTLPEARNDGVWSLASEARESSAVVVVFLGTECPVSNAYVPALYSIHSDYAQRGVVVVGVNSNAHDGADEVATHSDEYGLTFPVLKDLDGGVARRLHATRLATAVVLDASRQVRYHGRIDDQFERGVKRGQATKTELRDALEAVLAGREVETPSTTVVACPINLRKESRSVAPTGAASVTFHGRVAEILQRNCQGCHRDGEAGPFELATYADAEAWSGAIREVVDLRIMPPWHADPAHGRFSNDRRLSAADRAAVLAWVDAGCPEGDPIDAPAPRRFTRGWTIGVPDEVISMNKEFVVPAQSPKGGIAYQYIQAGEPFSKERWVTAAEVRPGERGVVHHVIVHILAPGQQLSMLDDELGVGDLLGALTGDLGQEIPAQLVAFVPGDQAFELPPGYAKRIPQGSRLVFEMHYTPNGKRAVDRSLVGLRYADRPPQHEVLGGSTLNTTFVIPPRHPRHRVEAEHTFDRAVALRSFNPHMHLRGRRFEYRLKTPGGDEEVLLSVPKYDFNWQHTYVLAEPKIVPKGSRLKTVAWYDNSPANPFNPDPERWVGWGDQTWDEMMLGAFEYYDASADQP